MSVPGNVKQAVLEIRKTRTRLLAWRKASIPEMRITSECSRE
jgi:hypothetical protein